MQYASQQRKRLLHYEADYALRMSTPNQRLRDARAKAGFETAVEAADALGVARSTYIGHENGSRGFPASRAPLYARRFKVTEQWLLYGKDAGESASEPNEEPIKYLRMNVALPSAPVLTAMFAGMLDQLGLDPNEGRRAAKLARSFPGALEAALLPHVTPNSLRRKIGEALPHVADEGPPSKAQ